MKATIKAKSGLYAGAEHDGRISQHRKEKYFCEEYAVLVPLKDAGYNQMFDDTTMKPVIIARLYSVPSKTYGNTLHACVWINSPTRKNRHSYSLSGGGKASGCGYHKASAALEAALNDAQVTFDKDIGGVGESAMREALAATVLAMGYKRYHIHYAHA